LPGYRLEAVALWEAQMPEAPTAIGILVVMIAAMIRAHRVKAKYLYGKSDRVDTPAPTDSVDREAGNSTGEHGNQGQRDLSQSG
jgi:hypothetical protein